MLGKNFESRVLSIKSWPMRDSKEGERKFAQVTIWRAREETKSLVDPRSSDIWSSIESFKSRY